MNQDEIRKLREKRQAAMDSAQALMDRADTENRSLTEEEKRSFEGFLDEEGKLTKELTKGEDELRRARLLEARQSAAAPEPRQTRAGQPGGLITPERIKRAQERGLVCFRGDGGADRARAFAHYAMAIRGVTSSRDWLEKRGIELRSMGIGTESAGGFLTPIEFATEIIDLMNEVGAVRRACRVWPMSRDVQSIPKVSTRPSWIALTENAAIAPSDGTGTYVTLTAKKFGGLTQVSNELVEDSLPQVGDILAQDIAYQAAQFEDTTVMLGDGTATYNSLTGIVPATGAAGIVTAAGNTPELVTVANFISMLGMVQDYALNELMGAPVWIFNRSVFARTAMRLMYALGGNTKEDLGEGVTPSLFGFPVIFSGALTSAPAANGGVIAIFGSLRTGVAFGDRRQMTIETSPHFYFNTDSLAVRGTERFGLQVHDAASAGTKGSMSVMKLPA
jgi:HK97 family phage major capsid protein